MSRWLIILASLAVGCSKFTPFTASQSTASLACPVVVATSKEASARNACENINNYVCESQVYGQNLVASKGVETQCVNVDSMGRACINVDTTTVAGPENSIGRTTVHCSNTGLAKPGTFVFQSSADNLEEALDSVIDKCKTGTL